MNGCFLTNGSRNRTSGWNLMNGSQNRMNGWNRMNDLKSGSKMSCCYGKNVKMKTTRNGKIHHRGTGHTTMPG